MAKIRNVIAQADDLKPNRFSEATKVQWLNEVEGYIQTDVMLLTLADIVQYDPETNMDTELLVKPPHDKLYAVYLCAMVDFANGEYDKYNNTMQLYNEYLNEYVKWYILRFRPADGRCEEEGYYISAYSLAVQHGYTGTLEDFGRDQAGFAENAEAVRLMRDETENNKDAASQSEKNAAGHASDAAASEKSAAESRSAAEAAESGAKQAKADTEAIKSAAEKSVEDARQTAVQDVQDAGAAEIREIQSYRDSAKQAAESAERSAEEAKDSAESAAGDAKSAAESKDAAQSAEAETRKLAEEAEQTVLDTLQEAKDSGEFDGGTPVITAERFGSSDGQGGIVLFITNADGSTYFAQLWDGDPGADGGEHTIYVTEITGGHRLVIIPPQHAGGAVPEPRYTDIMDGEPGRGIVSVERTDGTGAAGTTDTYTITYTDETSSTFEVYNGKDGTSYVLTDADKEDIAQIVADDAASEAIEEINAAGETAVGDITAAGNAQAQAVEAAGQAKLDEIAEEKLGAVRYDTAQELTEVQRATARENIDAVGREVYAYIDGAVDRAPKYGVSGVGGSQTKLTRLWDAAELTAMVGTDAVNPVYRNDFDSLQPFARRKCVGRWSQPDESGRAHFTVGAYYGDPDYAEDGSKGDYVAVEVRPLWFYQDLESGIIGVSGGKQTGWKPHPICLDEGGTIREYTYLPCYALAVSEGGGAVSLPGYHTSFGHYQRLRNTCRTYGGGNNAAHLEPMAVRHYEWLLFTIEFATTHCQSVMTGAASMPYSADDKVALDGTDVDHVVVTAAIGNKFVVGQTIYIGTTYSTGASADALNIITAIEPCDPDGTPNESGTYRRIIYSGRTNTVTAGTTTISARPWITGSCNDVTTPSGSPVSNTNGKYPMRYRYRENIWANCYSTCNDLFDVLAGAGTDDDPYHIIWHYLIDPDWFPASSSSPNATDFAGESFVQLDQITEHVSGYIKEIEADPDHPECIVPVSQTGGASATYFADYAYFVNGTTGIRSVRFGGHASIGPNAGVLYFGACYPVSYAAWSYGGGLYMRQ